MLRRLLLGLAATTVLGFAPAGAQTVKIDTGTLSGATAEGVASFKGIPYAAPPVGVLRWRPPQAAAKWTAPRDATHYGALCMQKIVKDNGVGPGPASEDCLTVNVFAPTGAKALPVMVWIHGGGLVNGSGTADLYDGTHLAQQGVVVVTLNYRLGRFGFFAHPALTAEAKGGPVANYGFMDQIAALKWVQRNIKAFGGDPAKVTIFGESAGGVSVNRLMLIPEAQGLFTKAISESGVGRERGQTLAQAEAAGSAFTTKLGAGTNLASIRALSADAIIAAGDPSMASGELPILDGRMLTESVLEAFRAGKEARVPYLVGSNSQEIPPAFAAAFGGFGKLPADQMAAGEQVYGSADALKEYLPTDLIFGEPARALAKAHARNGSATYLYRFGVVSAAAPKAFKGAIHASDRQYVFETLNASPWATDARDAALAKDISAYWVAFAKTGDPNGKGRTAWPAYGTGDRLIDFTNDGPVASKTPNAAQLDWLGKTEDAARR